MMEDDQSQYNAPGNRRLGQPSDIESTYKDEDDALSQYFGQSQYGGLSSIDPRPPRRMAGRPPTGDSAANRNPPLSKNVSTNYAMFLQDDNKQSMEGSGNRNAMKPPSSAERSMSPPNKGDTLSLL